MWEFAAPADKVTDFKASQAYFTGGSLGTEYLDSDLRVGVLPLPKYDEVLQLRVSEAPDDRDMVVLIYDTAAFDPAITFSDGNAQLWNLIHMTYFCVLDGNANITSYYQRNAKGAEKWLGNLMKKLAR